MIDLLAQDDESLWHIAEATETNPFVVTSLCGKTFRIAAVTELDNPLGAGALGHGADACAACANLT